MFDTMHIQKKKRDPRKVIRSLDHQSKEELIELVSAMIRNNADMTHRNDQISMLKKELNGYDFHTDYW